MAAGSKKRRSRKYPKIVLERATAEEILAAHGITERERRIARAIYERSKRGRSAAAK